MAGQQDSDAAALGTTAAVVPCYNAGPRLRPVVEGLLGVLERVIVVDDGSTDGAPSALGDLPARVITLPQNQGKGHAMMAGFRAALEDPAVDCVAIVDADGQHDPRELPGLRAAFDAETADLVIGSRVFALGRVPWRSWVGNRFTVLVSALLLGRRLPDTQSGYRLHSRRLLDDVLATVEGGRYETEMEILVKAVIEGYRVTAPPIRTIYETGNRSSHFRNITDSARIYRRLLRAVIRARAARRKHSGKGP